MRGGTSKGVFFRLQDLARSRAGTRRSARQAADARDRQPRPLRQADRRHGRRHLQHQQDRDRGKSTRPDHDVDYLFGQVSIDKPFVDWSGNCGNLSAAVGPSPSPTASSTRSHSAGRHGHGAHLAGQHQQDHHRPRAGHERPGAGNRRLRTGRRDLPGGRGAARIHGSGSRRRGGRAAPMFPTGNLVDELEVPGVGTLKATMINAGIPTIFVNAEDIGYKGAELQDAINGDPKALAMFEPSVPRRHAHGPDRARGRSGAPPAHAEGRLRRAAASITRRPAASR
jgi:hypothetical protein